MARWNFRLSTHCPRCDKEVEDKAHITQCPNAEATSTWQQSLKQLEKWFQESNMAHELSEAILWGLHQWRDPQRKVASPTGPYIMDQVVIGWDQFLDGWLAKSWWLHQEAAWQGVRSCRSSWWWVAELIKKLWNVSWDMWAHRNGILHQSTLARQDILEKHVTDQICAIYAGKTQALPRDALGFIRKPKDQVLQLPLTTKQQWLELVNIAIARQKRHDHGNYLSEQQFMATWGIHQ